jgi:hypothetical protein
MFSVNGFGGLAISNIFLAAGVVQVAHQERQAYQQRFFLKLAGQ